MMHVSPFNADYKPVKEPNRFIYALGPVGSYSGEVASILFNKIIHEQSPYWKCKTANRKNQYVQPEIRLTGTNTETIEILSGSDIGVVPFTNQLGGVVGGNMPLIKKLLGRGENIRILGWYFLRIQHVLACKAGANIEDIESIHSHPQALIQCREKLLELGCVDTEEITEGSNREPGEGEAMICRAQDWKNFEQSGFTLIQRGFQDEQNPDQRYTVFTCRGGNIDDVNIVLGTREALDACEESIMGFDKIQRVPEKSTTCHISEMKLNQAVVCSVEAARSAGLTILDEQFCPEDNTTHFAVIQKSKGRLHIPGLQTLDHERKICTIELHSYKNEASIRELMQDYGITILFEDREELRQRDLFTGVIEFQLSRNKLDKFVAKVNELGGRITII